jgi:hypothetical protein
MNWFTRKVPQSALIARLDNKDSLAAVEYLIRFTNNSPVEVDRLLQALTILALECRDWPQIKDNS